jgi:hypothetical protein
MEGTMTPSAALVLGTALTSALAQPAPPEPAPNSKITEAYAKHVGADVYFWAYPMLASYGRRMAASRTTETVLAGGFPLAPLNHLGMLSDYADPAQREIPCPDRDMIYGAGVLALDLSPVVVQVPYIGEHPLFWFYQLLDARGESFASMGSMYGTETGFYLLVGPDWKGDPPAGVKKVFRATTQTGMVIPRVLGGVSGPSSAQGFAEVIAMYPLAEFDGKMKTAAWKTLPVRSAERIAVRPETTFDVLADVLDDAPPRGGEEALYAQAWAVLRAAEQDPKLKAAMIAGAKESEEQLVRPLQDLGNYGRRLENRWSTIDNGSEFGSDVFARTAVARSMPFAPPRDAVAVLKLDTDVRGNRLDGQNDYTVTFPQNALPPGAGWSISLYGEDRFFVANPQKRYALGSKDLTLKPADDGSLTLHIQAEPPAGKPRENWLPAPRDVFSLVLRVYGPKPAVLDGSWMPPPVVRVQ